MKETLKFLCILIIGCLVISPCLLIFNEQPADEPQRWYINAIGFAYAVTLYFLVRKPLKSPKL
jgi:hypothetical protein